MPIAFRPRQAPEKSGPPPPKEAVEKFQEFFESESFAVSHQAFKDLLVILDIEVGQFHTFFFSFATVLLFICKRYTK